MPTTREVTMKMNLKPPSASDLSAAFAPVNQALANKKIPAGLADRQQRATNTVCHNPEWQATGPTTRCRAGIARRWQCYRGGHWFRAERHRRHYWGCRPSGGCKSLGVAVAFGASERQWPMQLKKVIEVYRHSYIRSRFRIAVSGAKDRNSWGFF